MKKITSLLNAKTLLVFAFTVCLGFWFGGFFDGYVVRIYLSKSFSESEARSLIGKQVVNVCSVKTNPERSGEVFGYSKDNFGDISAQIKWSGDDPRAYSNYSKGCFEQCVKLTDPE